MNFFSLLGRNFDSLGFVKSDYKEKYRGWLSKEGLEPDWAVELKDGSLQFILNHRREIKTIFVFDKNLIGDLLATPALCTAAQLTQKLGAPSRQSGETESAILGKQGAWIRYDNPHHVLHIQFELGGRQIKMVTLMSAGDAP